MSSREKDPQGGPESSASLSPQSRRNLYWEQFTELSLPASFALLEGSFCAILADKLYDAPGWVLALLTSAPMWANLSSYLWNRIQRGLPKVPLILFLASGILICLAVIALLPPGEIGLAVLVSAMVAGRLLIAGILTARSLVWSLNYIREFRARSTARLHTLASIVTIVVASFAGWVLDDDPGNFRWLYGMGIIPGMIGIWCFWHVRVPGELRQRAEERKAHQIATSRGAGVFRILRTDRDYARYMLYQFLSGTSVMGVEAPLVYLVSREIGAGFLTSISITLVIPFVIGLLALPAWARYLDKSHVVRFRFTQSHFMLSSLILLWIGAELSSIYVIIAARVASGLVRSAGGLAWQIGHNDFAPRANLAGYMSLHVTLTGIRGAFAPLLCMALYLGFWGWDGLGGSMFLAAAALCALSSWGFWKLRQDMQARESQGRAS